MKKSRLVNFWKLLVKAASEFMDDRGMKLGAALSYYTVFSLPPLLVIIIAICGIFFGTEAVQGQIYGQIKGLTGNEAAAQIQEMLKNVKLSHDNILATTLGVITLIFGASGVFAEIQDSINFIWGLKAKPKRGFARMVFNRLMSFSMIVSVGFLLLVSLVINALVELLGQHLERMFASFISVWFLYAVNLLLVLVITTILFSVIFKTLPDGKIAWKDTIYGAGFTAVLFMIGKAGIGIYLGNSSVTTTYGAAGSVIVILLWVYYSALILYYGAEFTKVYAYTYGNKVTPNDYAVHIDKLTIENEHGKMNEPVAQKG